MTPIIQLITTSIAPGTWKVQDGSARTDRRPMAWAAASAAMPAASTSSDSLVRSFRSSSASA